MTDSILQEIARERCGRPLKLPLSRFAGAARRYLELGVFKLTNEYYREVPCPNGCGEDVFVEGRVDNGYVVTCEHRGIPEEIVIPVERVQLCEFDEVTFNELVAQGVIKCGGKAGRQRQKHYDKPKTKDWNQKKAAAMLGISTRQLRSYKTNPPDEYWPGWTDSVALKQWMNQREDRDLMAQAMSRSVPYREGATEKARKRGI